jgi:hypothetical protein
MYSGGQNRVTGLNLEGTFANAIFGSNMERAIVTDNVIDPPADNGIFLQNSGAAIPTSQLAYIARNTIDGAGSSGIAMKSYLSDTLAHTQAVAILDNTITGAGGNGVQRTVSATGLAGFSDSVTIAGNSISNIAGPGFAGVGIADKGYFRSMAGTVTQHLAIDGNDITSVRAGILVRHSGFSIAGMSQELSAIDNSLGVVSSFGIGIVEGLGSISGPAIVNVAVSGNAVASAGTVGIISALNARSIGALLQTTTIDGNSVGTASIGIQIGETIRDASGPVVATMSISDNRIASAGDTGILLGLVALYLQSLSQAIAIDGNSVGVAGGDGIHVEDRLISVGAVGSSVSASGNAVTSASGDGIGLTFYEHNLGSLSQVVALARNSIGAVGSDGIAASESLASISGTAVDGLSASYNLVASAGRDGIAIALDDASLAGLSQSAAIDHNSVGHASGNGIFLSDNIVAVTGAVSTGLSFGNNRITSAGANGLYIRLDHTSLGGLSHTVAVYRNSVETVGRDGILLNNNISAVGGTAGSGLSFDGNTIVNAGGYGILLTHVVASATVLQSLTIDSNDVSAATTDGIASRLFIGGAGAIAQGGTINANTVRSAGGNGMLFGVVALGPVTADVNLSLSGNTLTLDAGNGFAGLASGAGVSETFTLVSGSGNHFTGNGGAGAYLSNTGGSLAFHINGNDLSGNAGGTTATAGAVTITP